VLGENKRIVTSGYFRITELTSSRYFKKSKSKNQSVLNIFKMWILCRTPVLSRFFDILSFGQINLGPRVEHKMKIVAYTASLIIETESALYFLNLNSFQVLWFLKFQWDRFGGRVEHKMRIVTYIASLITEKGSTLYLLEPCSFQVFWLFKF
jgi:hypothetical protein